MNEIKVSIIVPVYKCENTIENSVRSLQKQSLKDIEIILVDDGSPDKSGDLCEKIASNDHRITVIHKANGGAGSARNAGMQVAKGDYIGFMDADDWIDVEMFETMYSLSKKNDLDLIRCNTIIFQNGSKRKCWSPSFCGKVLDTETARKVVIPMLIAPENEGKYNERLLKGCVCCLFRKDLITKNNIEFCCLKSGEDARFTMTAMWNASRLMLIDNPFYKYVRQEFGSLSISLDRLQNYSARHESRDMLKSLIGNTEYKPIYEQRWAQADRRYVYLDVRIATIYNPNGTMKEKIQLIKKILNSEECKQAFSKPYSGKLPFQMALLYYLIKHNYAVLLYVIVNLKFALFRR